MLSIHIVLDLRALSKVTLRVPFRAMLFCVPFSVTKHIFDLYVVYMMYVPCPFASRAHRGQTPILLLYL